MNSADLQKKVNLYAQPQQFTLLTKDSKTPKISLIPNHKGTRMVKDGED